MKKCNSVGSGQNRVQYSTTAIVASAVYMGPCMYEDITAHAGMMVHDHRPNRHPVSPASARDFCVSRYLFFFYVFVLRNTPAKLPGPTSVHLRLRNLFSIDSWNYQRFRITEQKDWAVTRIDRGIRVTCLREAGVFFGKGALMHLSVSRYGLLATKFVHAQKPRVRRV